MLSDELLALMFGLIIENTLFENNEPRVDIDPDNVDILDIWGINCVAIVPINVYGLLLSRGLIVALSSSALAARIGCFTSLRKAIASVLFIAELPPELLTDDNI